jgi:hypothetical protein
MITDSGTFVILKNNTFIPDIIDITCDTLLTFYNDDYDNDYNILLKGGHFNISKIYLKAQKSASIIMNFSGRFEIAVEGIGEMKVSE